MSMNVNERAEMTLRDYWRVLVRRRWIVLIALIATVTPAVLLTLAQETIYEAEAQMLVNSRPNDSLFGGTAQGAVNADRAVQNEIRVLEGEVVYQRVRDNLGLDTLPPRVRGSAVGATDVIAVRVRSGDPATAQLLADAYVQAYIDTKRDQGVDGLVQASEQLSAKVTELQGQIDAIDTQLAASPGGSNATLEQQRLVLVNQQAVFKQRLDQLQVDAALISGNAQLVRPAPLPVSPVEPTPARTVMLALVVGLLLGIGMAFFVDYLDDSVRSPQDLANLAAPLPVLAVVPVDPPPDNRPIALSRPDDFAVESYRTLRTNVTFLGFERDLRSLQITSAMPGEGKTTTAANLAVVLAQAGSRVILVDADLRRPRIHEVFAIDGSVGLTNVLLGEPIILCSRPIDDTLTVLPSGPVPPNPSEMLSGRAMAALVNDLKTQFDYVIIDSAPVLPVSDAVAVSRQVDGVLVVTQSNRTSVPQVRQTLANLEQVSAPLLGMVLNKASGRQANYGYQYGYGYGYGSQYKSKAPATTAAPSTNGAAVAAQESASPRRG
jgi:non-specific protein-tyrosine kinase